ncbi:MAG: hypothetical protein FWD55_04465 [Propionibacteriaceae bacterium]|nr:hypothetical protein [Propionibacteriaceae bacterium]
MDLTDFAAASKLLGDMSASSGDLMKIAQCHPSLRAQVASHPQTDPALFDWLDALGDPAVSGIIAKRRVTSQSSAVSPISMPVDFVDYQSPLALSQNAVHSNPQMPMHSDGQQLPSTPPSTPSKRKSRNLIAGLAVVLAVGLVASCLVVFTDLFHQDGASTPGDFQIGWVSTLCGSNWDGFFDVAVTESGNIIAIGASTSWDYDFADFSSDEIAGGITAVYDPTGELISLRRFAGYEFDSIASAGDDTVVIAGRILNDLVNREPLLMKLGDDGGVLWTSTGPREVEGRFTTLRGISVDQQGHITIFGYLSDWRYFAAQFNDDGSPRWYTEFDEVDYIGGITTTPSGDIYLVGQNTLGEEDFSDENYFHHAEALVMKLSSDGVLIWKQTYGGGGFNSFRGVASFEDGIVAVGEAGPESEVFPSQGQENAILAIIDGQGKLVSGYSYGGNGGEVFHTVAVVDNQFFTVGSTTSGDGDFPSVFPGVTVGANGVVAQINAKGTLRRASTFGGSGTDVFSGLAANSLGIIVVGDVFSTNGNLPASCGDRDAVIAYFPIDEN